MKIKKIVLIGAGKLAHQLVPALISNDFEIIQIYNRSVNRLKHLSKIANCSYTTTFSQVKTTADLYIICIKDDAIKSVSKLLCNVIPEHAMVVHTSGVRPISDLAQFQRYGLFYPLHTFTEKEQQSFDHIPIIINANTDKTLNLIQSFGNSISNKIFLLTDEQRPYLHLAAVLANNFTNHILGKAFEILGEHGIEQEILYPIIKEGTNKAILNNPFDIQTGPAVRGDDSTISKHLDILESDKKLKAIYKMLSDSIIDVQKPL